MKLHNYDVGIEKKYKGIIATDHENKKKYKCICPTCNKWINEWYNWSEAKETGIELKAKCICGSIIPLEKIKMVMMK